jgi:flagellar hook assembly protein FlgD
MPVVFSIPAAKLSKSSSSVSRFRIVVSAHDGATGYLPTTPELAQNYPNPFNPTTNISFSLPAKSRVTILVFNILGQRVATVTDQEYPAGNHIVMWNASNVASGVYFYRMTAAEKTQTKKMVVLR